MPLFANRELYDMYIAMARIVSLLTLTMLVVVVVVSASLVSRFQVATTPHDEARAFPKVGYAKVVSLGFPHVLSNYYLFKTVNYFGREYRSERDYRWLAHMCKVVVSLNGYDQEVNSFCSSMLAWEANDIDAAQEVLSIAIERQPLEWYYWYVRGFNSYYFKKNHDAAVRDLKVASGLPGVHPIVVAFAKKLESGGARASDSLDMLEYLIQRTKNKAEKDALIRRHQELQRERENQYESARVS